MSQASTSTAVLQRLAHEVIEQAKRAYACWGARLPASLDPLPAGTWSRSRRVVIKVEVSEQGVNTRFVVDGGTGLHPKCSIGTSTVPVVKWKTRSKTTSHLKSSTSCHSLRGQSSALVIAFGVGVLLDTLRRC